MSAIERGFCVVDQRLRRARLDAGLTQTELAEKAGYCDRLIRKAESGGRLNFQTLADIVSALREGGSTIDFSNLIVDPGAIANEFIKQMNTHGRDMIAHCEHLFTENFEFVCAGLTENIPFAGTFVGRDGMQNWLELLYDSVSSIPVENTSVCFFFKMVMK